MDLSNLEEVLKGEPKYRLKEAEDFVYTKLIENWNEATSLSKNLREKLAQECPLEIKAESLTSKSGDSIKAKITLKDGLEIEAVLMRHKDGRNTVCVSCQVGCPMNCAFCATGKMGLIRNLDYLEIIEQVLFFTRLLRRSNPHNDTNQTTPDVVQTRVTNVTFMGMGEPFLNYDNVFKAIEILNNKDYFGISIRNISVSTCGVIEGIEKLADSGLQVNPHTKRAGNASVEGTWNNARSGVGVNLAISLHAPNNELRGKLMPVNKKYPLEKVLTAVDEYIKKTKRKVMFEYVLIKDVNDTDECAKQLAKLMKKKLYFLNLILYNDTGVFKASETKRVQAFKNILAKERINFVQRYRFGDDIKAACGQFATQSKG